jgi:5'-3' exonuclease
MSITVLVDISAEFWRNWFATTDGLDAYEGTLADVKSLVEQGDRLIMCCDGPRLRRKVMYDDYKANRPPKPKEAIDSFHKLKSTLADEYQCIEVEGYEADDVIASYVHQRPDEQILIVSGDKDLYQLIRSNVQMLTKNELVGRDGCFAKFGVEPNQIADLLTLTGDSADNIPGCPGIGPGRAKDLLTAFGDVDSVKNATDEELRMVKGMGDKTIAALRAWDPSLARELVQLFVDVPLPGERVTAPEKIQKTEKKPIETGETTMSKMSLESVTRGRVDKPHRILIYGPEGIGKTCFAADAPSPVFINAEGGTDDLDVARFPEPEAWGDVLSAVETLKTTDHTYQTLAIDPMGWFEPMLYKSVCDANSWSSIDDPAYGAGYNAAMEEWRKLTVALDELQLAKSMNVILVAHHLIRTHRHPELDEFDRFEVAIYKRAAGLLRQWCRTVLFADYDTETFKEGKRVRAVGTGHRYLHTSWRPAFDAKNRFGLPPKIPLGWADFEDAVKSGAPASIDDLRAELNALLAAHPDQEYVKKARAVAEKLGNNPKKLSEALDRIRATVSSKIEGAAA